MYEFRNQSDSDKKTSVEITNVEQRSPENSVHLSANTAVNKSSTDIATTAKKDISYIFQLNVTKKKLETIQKKVEKLLAKSAELENMINEKYALQKIFVKQYYDVDMKYQRNLVDVSQRMTAYGIEDPSVLLHPDKRADFFNTYIANYQKNLNAQFVTILKTFQTVAPDDSSEEKEKKKQAFDAKKQELDKILSDSVAQEAEYMEKFLDELSAFYFDIQVDTTFLEQKKNDIDTLNKEMGDLQKKLSDLSDRIKEEQEKYNEVTTHGLLKSYEVSGSKISINDLVAHPSLELQLKKLIALFNNQTEAKKF